MQPAIIADGLSKRFFIRTGEVSTKFSSRAAGWLRPEFKLERKPLWALNDVNFDVAQGEILGIIGRNGSGKSTLLKVLSGIMRPTRGNALVRGRIGALLEVGTGFHPDMTGRENVFFNGILLGMSRDDIRSKFDEIVAFAEVEKFIDMQIKHFSSGMQARLGFAVAAHLRPEILVVDEVLSVGDILFQEKSIARMGEMRKSSITTLFVSHNLNSVAAICDRSILLDRGMVKALGATRDVIDKFVPPVVGGKARAEFDSNGSSGPARLICAALECEDGTPVDQFDIAEDIWLRVRYTVKVPLAAFQLSVRVRVGHDILFQTDDTDQHTVLGIHSPGLFEKRLKIRNMFLKEGDYAVSILSGIPLQLLEEHDDILQFSVVARSMSTEFKSFRRERPGKIIFQGEWLGPSKP